MTQCIIFSGCKDRKGYGIQRHEGKVRKAHRVAYVQHHGITHDVIADRMVRHACDNPSCVNPAHLEIGTAKDNAQDREKRQRAADHRGESNASARLSAEDVLSIRAALATGVGRMELAKKYGVTRATISEIKTRRKWRHI